jgi:NTP pyrophosphatase (non-canonical NTP hydrolase)
MELNEYQKKALTTAAHAEKYKIIYPALGLGNEAGEVLGKVKKWLRGDDGACAIISDERRQALKEELGDVLWYIAVLAHDLGLNLEDIGTGNIDKLQSRKARGVIKGDGDNR